MNLSDKPLVTAVITTYKRSPEIVKRALDSIIMQDYENIEIFVVNDYPSDAKLVESLRSMINEVSDSRAVYYLVMDQNGGACRARNMALNRAKGKYFACLDDDDEWLPEKIGLQVERMEQSPDVAIAYCNAIIRHIETKKESVRFNTPQNEGNIFAEMIAKNVIGSCSFPLFRTDIIKSYGGFNAAMPALQDWELYLRILKRYKAVYVHKPLAVYYFYEGERISAHPEKRTEAYELLHNHIKLDLPSNKKCASAFYLMGTYFYSLAGDMRKAFEYYRLGIVNDPLNFGRNIKDFFRMVGRRVVKTQKV